MFERVRFVLVVTPTMRITAAGLRPWSDAYRLVEVRAWR